MTCAGMPVLLVQVTVLLGQVLVLVLVFSYHVAYALHS